MASLRRSFFSQRRERLLRSIFFFIVVLPIIPIWLVVRGFETGFKQFVFDAFLERHFLKTLEPALFSFGIHPLLMGFFGFQHFKTFLLFASENLTNEQSGD